jgi:putative flippase GtrA
MIKRLTKHLLVRYLIAGSIATIINLSLFFLLHHVYHLYYITASIIAFTLAFLVSLILQKFWTFRDHSLHKFYHQIGKYLLTSALGLVVDILVLYICVQYFSLYALVGQIVAGAASACCTFFLSSRFVFKVREKSNNIEIETDFEI